MKKLSIIISLLVFSFLQADTAVADKEQLQFSIQKVKTDIEKNQKKGEEVKLDILELQKARDFLKQAETELVKNKNWRGALNKDAEPLIAYYTEMAEIYTAIAFSRLSKFEQDKENTRLEKQIPELEAKIKIFDDKNAEIKKLKEELEKPQSKIRDVNTEIASLKKEKAELAEQLSQMKAEKEKLSGKAETLNELVAAVRKDLAERIKTVENLSTENKILQESIKSSENQKGDNLHEMQAKLKLLDTMTKIGLVSKTSPDEYTFIIPRNKLIKTGAKNPALAPDAEGYIDEIVEKIKHFPDAKLSIKVYGSGKNEDTKITAAMANLLKKALIGKGINESSVQAMGAGNAAPLFSKAAVEENRCIGITISGITGKK